jgi:hypothetical protein
MAQNPERLGGSAIDGRTTQHVGPPVVFGKKGGIVKKTPPSPPVANHKNEMPPVLKS